MNIEQQTDRMTWPPTESEDIEDLTEALQDELFHIGEPGEKEAAKTLRCLKCGSKQFNVGTGSFYTAIRCPHCEWETCIHLG